MREAPGQTPGGLFREMNRQDAKAAKSTPNRHLVMRLSSVAFSASWRCDPVAMSLSAQLDTF